MNTLIKTLTILFAVLSIISCSSPEEGNVHVKGVIEGVENRDQIYLFKVTDKVEPFDTADISSSGEFLMVSQIENPGFYRLGFNQHDNYLSMILQPDDQIELNSRFGAMETKSDISGSEETEVLQEFFTAQTRLQAKMDSIRSEMQYAQQNQNAGIYRQAMIQGRILEQQKDAQIKEFLNEHSDKIAALAAVSQLSPDKDYELFKEITDNLEGKMNHNPIFKKIQNQVEKLASTQVGAQAPEIDLPSPDGENISLSSLKGQYVLIDFWASWCKPCRIENPNVVKMYNKFKDKGFEIYGVSLDKEKSKWEKAIKEDNIEWIQVSDLKGWNCEGAKTYNVNTIPETVLINPEGEIIARNLRGNSLEEKLNEVLIENNKAAS